MRKIDEKKGRGGDTRRRMARFLRHKTGMIQREEEGVGDIWRAWQTCGEAQDRSSEKRGPSLSEGYFFLFFNFLK